VCTGASRSGCVIVREPRAVQLVVSKGPGQHMAWLGRRVCVCACARRLRQCAHLHPPLARPCHVLAGSPVCFTHGGASHDDKRLHTHPAVTCPAALSMHPASTTRAR
jgi:hypothetical protein